MTYKRTEQTGSGAINVSHAITENEKLISVAITFDVAPTTSENLTITLDDADGAAYDVTLQTIDPSAHSATEILYYPDGDVILESGDAIVVAYANADARTWTVTVITEGTGSATSATRLVFDAVFRTARLLGGMRMGIATGGSTTTIVDTDRTEGDDYWNNGTAFIVDTVGDGSPIHEFQRISDYVQSTGTITVDDPFTAAVDSGDRYALLPAVPPDVILMHINTALSQLRFPVWDTTSLTVQDGVTEYTLPADIMRGDLREVYVQTEDDSTDNRWKLIYGWRLKPGATGAQDTLILPKYYDSGKAIALVYIKRHTDIYDAGDSLNEFIPLDLIVYQAAANVLMERLAENSGDDSLPTRINFLLDQARQAQQAHAQFLPERTPNIMRW